MSTNNVSNNSDVLIWYNGKIMPLNEAQINIMSPTSQFGLNVFEGIPCYWNDEEKQLYAFRLNDHYDRLLRSAKLIQLDCLYTKEDFKTVIDNKAYESFDFDNYLPQVYDLIDEIIKENE